MISSGTDRSHMIPEQSLFAPARNKICAYVPRENASYEDRDKIKAYSDRAGGVKKV